MEGYTVSCIQGLTLSEANYDAKRFGRLQQIITAHMEELLIIQGSVGNHPSSLCSTFDKIMTHVRGLESLRISSGQYGSLRTYSCHNVKLLHVKLTRKHGTLRSYCKLLSKKWMPGKCEGTLVNPGNHPKRTLTNSNLTTNSIVTIYVLALESHVSIDTT